MALLSLVCLLAQLRPATAGERGLRRTGGFGPAKDPCGAVLRSEEARRLSAAVRDYLGGSAEERSEAARYLTGRDTTDPVALAHVHNITAHRVIAPALCHVLAGGSDGDAMLWALLDAHDGERIGDRGFWGRWLGGYQLSETIALALALASSDRQERSGWRWRPETEAALDRAIEEFASVNRSAARTRVGERLVDTAFEDNALNFMAWSWVAAYREARGDHAGRADAAAVARAFYRAAFALEHVCWVAEGVAPEDLDERACREDGDALVTEERAHRLHPEAVPPPTVMLFNHGMENPYYGVGSLNHMASGLAILAALGEDRGVHDERSAAVASGLIRWAGSKVGSDGAYERAAAADGDRGCLVTEKNDGTSRVRTRETAGVVRAVRAYCGDPGGFGGYAPRHTPLRAFVVLADLPERLALGRPGTDEFADFTDLRDPHRPERRPFFSAVWNEPERRVLDHGRRVLLGVLNDELLCDGAGPGIGALVAGAARLDCRESAEPSP